jgi:hypothetical protein
VRKAISWPARQIAINAGEDGAVIVGKILEKDTYAYGFDAQSGEYVNMVSKGIIDPTKVVRTALQGAASVAGSSRPRLWSPSCRRSRAHRCRAGLEAAWVVWTSKPKWEFPRLCRGGSKSLTYPGVGSIAPPMRRRLVSRQATRKGVPPMDNHEKLSHTK